MAQNDRTRVLVCEDEDSIRELIILNLKMGKDYLERDYEVVAVSTGEEALQTFAQENGNFDIVLLDVMLPGIDGFTVCKRLREVSNVGIIMLTAKAQEMDKVNALYDKGADDYMTKPFAPSELLARMCALCRRLHESSTKPEEELLLKSGPFVVNLKSRSLTKNGEPIALTDSEYKIILYFLRNKNTALDRASILVNIWGENYYGYSKIVDVNIRRLRMKIEDDPSDPKYILTIWGYGYKWEDKSEPNGQ